MFGDNQPKKLTDDEIKQQLIEAGVDDPDETDIQLFREEHEDMGDKGKGNEDETDDDDSEKDDDTETDPKKKTPAPKKKPAETDDDSDEDEDDDDDGSDDDDDDDDANKHDQKPPARPVRYIPVPQYRSEKKQWKQDREALEAKIESLETKGTNDAPAGSKTEDQLISEFKTEFPEADEKQVRKIIQLARAGVQIPESLKRDIEAGARMARDMEETKFFDRQFTDILPQIQARFPDADQAMLDKIKKRLDFLGHTKELHKTPLAYVFANHANEFEASDEDESDQKPGKRSVEKPRATGNKTSSKLTAKDFKGKTDFTPLIEMDEADRNKIIADMDGPTWEAFVAFSDGDGVEVNRGGRKLKLK